MNRLLLASPVAAMALALSACGSEPVEQPKAAPTPAAPVDTTNYEPRCDAASLSVMPYTKNITLNQTRPNALSVTVFGSVRNMRHEPELNRAGPRPTVNGPGRDGWEIWVDQQAADRALLRASYGEQANYVFDLFERACPDVDITELRGKMVPAAPAPSPSGTAAR